MPSDTGDEFLTLLPLVLIQGFIYPHPDHLPCVGCDPDSLNSGPGTPVVDLLAIMISSCSCNVPSVRVLWLFVVNSWKKTHSLQLATQATVSWLLCTHEIGNTQ